MSRPGQGIGTCKRRPGIRSAGIGPRSEQPRSPLGGKREGGPLPGGWGDARLLGKNRLLTKNAVLPQKIQVGPGARSALRVGAGSIFRYTPPVCRVVPPPSMYFSDS